MRKDERGREGGGERQGARGFERDGCTEKVSKKFSHLFPRRKELDLFWPWC